MSGLQEWAQCAGEWHGTNRLHYPQMVGPDESPSTITVTPMIGGRCVRLDYTWAYDGQTQEGTLLLGGESETGRVAAFWADTWHTGGTAMICHGVKEADALDIRGSYAAPPGPDWGWRIVVRGGSDSFALQMFNVTPEGIEEAAVEASYVR